VLVIHGTEDLCQPISRAERFAELTGGRLVILDGAGHAAFRRGKPGRNRAGRSRSDRSLEQSKKEAQDQKRDERDRNPRV